MYIANVSFYMAEKLTHFLEEIIMDWFEIILCVLGSMILLFCIVGLRLGMATDEFKIKRRYVVIFLMAIMVLNICGTVWFALFEPRTLFSIIAGLVGWGIDMAFLAIVIKDKRNLWQQLIVSMLSILMVPCIWNVMITQMNAYTHTLVYDYEISIVDNEVITEYDENLYGLKEIVDETVENMKKYGATYYKGSVEVEYKCMYPPFKNLHDSYCTCTDRKICDVCEEHSFREGDIKEVNID